MKRVNKVNRILSLTICVLAVAVSLSGASDRTWMKERISVNDENGEHLADLAIITTTDDNTRKLMRILFEDSANRLLVIYWDVETETLETDTSFTLISSGEKLQYGSRPSSGSGPDMLTLQFGSETINFNDDERTSDGTRNQAAQMYQSRSSSFDNALKSLMMIGLNHSISLFAPALNIQEVLYSSIEVPPIPGDGETRLEFVAEFDPLTDPPDEFESKFGNAYFE